MPPTLVFAGKFRARDAVYVAVKQGDERKFVSAAHKSTNPRAEITPAASDGFLTAKILEAQDNERRKISRELHDSVGGSLTAIKLSLAKLKSKLSAEDLLVLEEVEQMVDAVTAEIRTVSHLLHPPMLDLLGMRSSIVWYVEGFQHRTGIQASIELPESLPKFEGAAETALFRIVQECLTNVHRHASASTVVIKVSVDGDFHLEITDDGAGFPDGFRDGIGLHGMRERVHELGGEFRVESGNQAGSSIIVRIPLSQN